MRSCLQFICLFLGLAALTIPAWSMGCGAIAQRDANNSGYNWTAIYDPLNRRISTTTVLVTNGVVYPASSQTINSYFDPQVEFLEVGVAYGTKTEWKLYGPGMDGQYGEMNGVGALDAVSPELSLFNPTVCDVRGDILGYYDSSVGSVNWNAARPTGYGAVPGYRPVALASGGTLAQSSSWRGLWPDITGYYNIGLRPYDPISGRWLTFDSTWNANDPNYYSFCGGDPVNGFDSNGKCAVNTPPSLYFGVAPVMATYTETKLLFADETSVSTGLPGEPSSVIYDPNQLGGYNYNVVTEPTGEWEPYVSENPLPANYGDTTITPITRYDLEAQADIQAIKVSAVVLGTGLTGTEEFAPELLGGGEAAEGTMATREGLIGISEHLTQLPGGGGIDAANSAMYSRLTTAFENGQALTGTDAAFYQHELLESSLMDAGMDARAAHLETLSQQGIPYAPGYEAQLYHPTVIQQFPTSFSPAAQAAAGVH